MNLSKSLTTWGMIIGLIIFGALAAVALSSSSTSVEGAVGIGGGAPPPASVLAANAAPANEESAAGTIELKNPINGDVIALNEWVVLGGLTALMGGLIVGAGIPLVFIFRALDTGVAKIKDDEEFKSAIAARTSEQKAVVKEYMKSQPPDPIPSHDRPGWSVISTSMCMGMLAAFLGAAFSANFLDERNMGAYAFWFAVVAMAIGLITLNSSRIQATDAEEGGPIPGGLLWIVITGVIVVGLGVGVMMWVRGGGI